ncbi:NADP-dependent 3-hydroxy acid dehydrogenase YdfG [Halohasta litchfieldiae]|jgi:NADP-dependent 3-hydroxy acid dehydrogenase YdfG|uniref:NADP-dependent 3-hydroxy acid dehydrogenase YdfG n=1 Tax=Halohasta litchfieldiae TaxID=1073996 RepID=A0A1H6VUV9_9EURY|nr:SDR family oxidoreductase [Halohasta litchfieldiae]ATW87241.1 NADP-dependent 3-hydroxy acid dehydrogenase YdfG [Halohasta litchfieldiae]SEJ08468.1 NADP-dependent 3-hydroxy acid dehydrogenase YdfG [Halohasta litchfieldiae]
MTDSLDGQTAIVTGASAGIGAATCRQLAAEGANVVLAARSKDKLAELADDLETTHGVDTLVVPTDVRKEYAVDALLTETVDTFGGIDIVVNNAGLARGSDVEELTNEQYDTMQETNVDGVFYMTRAAIPHVREREGHLIFLGSFAGQYPRSFNPVYAASKWWVRGFAKSVAAQVGDEGVGVTVVNPSEVRSEFEATDGRTFAEVFDEDEATEPEEVAEAIVFAATREGSSLSEIDINRRDKFADGF